VTALEVPLRFRRGRRQHDDEVAARSASFSLDYLRDHFGLDTLEATAMLDVGCGTKFTQCFIDNEIPIKRYVGLDVDRELIDFLRANVDDPRFEYHHVDFANARYNPGGRRMTEDAVLPIGGERFDLIVLFSVFTHLDPDDYRAMLELLRPHVEEGGRLLYTLFIDERSDGGHGLMDALAKRLGEQAVGRVDRFKDLNPEKALVYAVYERAFAVELVEGTGWAIERVDPPNEHMQHQFTCRPV
jgi:SAM-dependent methyltransferase